MKLALKEGDVPKHVALPTAANVNRVPEVPQGRADHVRGEDVAELLLLPLPAAPLQVDRHLGGHLTEEQSSSTPSLANSGDGCLPRPQQRGL